MPEIINSEISPETMNQLTSGFGKQEAVDTAVIFESTVNWLKYRRIEDLEKINSYSRHLLETKNTK